MTKKKFNWKIITEKLQGDYVATSTFDISQGMCGQGGTRQQARRDLIKQIVEAIGKKYSCGRRN